MPVKDLQAGQGKVDIELDITEILEARSFEKFGKSGKVASALGRDETGTIKLSLWNEQVDLVKQGDRVKLTNGYVNEYKGELQLSSGKFGKLEVVGKAEQPVEKQEPQAPPEDDDIEVEEEDVN